MFRNRNANSPLELTSNSPVELTLRPHLRANTWNSYFDFIFRSHIPRTLQTHISILYFDLAFELNFRTHTSNSHSEVMLRRLIFPIHISGSFFEHIFNSFSIRVSIRFSVSYVEITCRLTFGCHLSNCIS